MDSVLIIGAGAAGSVVAKKCAMDRETFKHIHLASRRLVSCEQVVADCVSPIEISQVDADNVNETGALIERVKPDLVINMALHRAAFAKDGGCNIGVFRGCGVGEHG